MLACSEADIEALQPRPGSPAWLVGEVEAIKQGLLDLRHNVVLLRSPDSPDDFTPVRPCLGLLVALVNTILLICKLGHVLAA